MPVSGGFEPGTRVGRVRVDKGRVTQKKKTRRTLTRADPYPPVPAYPDPYPPAPTRATRTRLPVPLLFEIQI